MHQLKIVGTESGTVYILPADPMGSLVISEREEGEEGRERGGGRERRGRETLRRL